jgi:hypothetical protein
VYVVLIGGSFLAGCYQLLNLLREQRRDRADTDTRAAAPPTTRPDRSPRDRPRPDPAAADRCRTGPGDPRGCPCLIAARLSRDPVRIGSAQAEYDRLLAMKYAGG